MKIKMMAFQLSIRLAGPEGKGLYLSKVNTDHHFGSVRAFGYVIGGSGGEWRNKSHL